MELQPEDLLGANKRGASGGRRVEVQWVAGSLHIQGDLIDDLEEVSSNKNTKRCWSVKTIVCEVPKKKESRRCKSLYF